MNISQASVLLIDPKFPHNVGNALRACALLGADTLAWTGSRVPPTEDWPEGARLPREERMKCYNKVVLAHYDNPADLLRLVSSEWTPVCVEITDSAEDLIQFDHPYKALYVFGPEDGDVPKTARMECHRFIRIPLPDPEERTPFNLAAAITIVLYDRFLKSRVEINSFV